MQDADSGILGGRGGGAVLAAEERAFPGRLHDLLPIGHLATSSDGRMLRANHRLAAKLGYDSADDLVRACAGEARRLWEDPEDWDVLASLALSRGEMSGYPVLLRRRDGTVLPCAAWVRLDDRPWAGGRVVEVALRSEAEEHRAFAALVQALRLYRDMMELNPDPVLVHREGRVLLTNPAAEAFFRSPERGSLVGCRGRDLMVDSSAREIRRHIRAALVGRPMPGELQLVLASGDARWVRAFSTTIMHHGRPAVLSLLHDRTSRRRAELALGEVERLHRAVLEHLPEAVCLHDDGRILYANPCMRELLVPQEEADPCGRSLAEHLHPDSLPDYERRRSEVMASQGVTCGEFPLRFADGRLVHVSERTVPVDVGGRRLFLAILRDVSDRVAAEQARDEVESLYRTIVETSPGILFIHEAGRLLYVNPAAGAFMGAADPESLLGMRLHDLLGPVMAPVIDARIRAVLAGPGASEAEYDVLMPGGGTRRVNERSVRVDYLGRPAILAVVHDLTAHRRAEAERDQALASYQNLFRCAPLGIARFLRSQGYARVNRRMAEMFGYPSPEAMTLEVGDDPSRLYADPEDHARLRRMAGMQEEVRDFECLSRRRDGTLFWTSRSIREVRGHDGSVQGCEVFVRDIDDRRRAKAEAEERGRRVRVLAGDLAMASERERRTVARNLHDGPVQLLALATLMVEDLARKRGLDREFAPALDLLREAAGQLRTTLDDLTPPALFADDLAGTLDRQGGELLRRHGLEVEVSCPGLPGLSREGTAFLCRTVRELLVNAVKHGRARRAEVLAEARGRTLRITVRDDGCGFDSARLGADGSRTQGLPGLRCLVRDLGGGLEVESAPGRGTRVRLTLPLDPLCAAQPLLK
ncbi:MAG: PAS domain S-box protein [Thermodesulfobacteriota bacterium]